MASFSGPGGFKPSTKARPSYETLTAMSEVDLINQYEIARASDTAHDMDWFLDEIVRRRQDRATDAMIELTGHITKLTVVLVVLTVIGTSAAIYAAVMAS
jgi:hypothetical protein